ncbi:hypothetical protein [Bombella intestini]|uniref:hypothetical protein n=1 Tax=Bombella intestini TaxID=1539051 RepID=UPI000985CF83|nr:hypothetical protein [Bombella intestini]
MGKHIIPEGAWGREDSNGCKIMALRLEQGRLDHEALEGVRQRKLMVRVRRKLSPCIIMVFLAFVLSAPFGILGQTELQTALTLGTVWFWALYRPAFMPLFGLFCSGLVIELFSANPPGVLLFWMLVAYGVAHGCRVGLSRRGFLLSWILYGLIVLGEAMTDWVLMVIRVRGALSVYPIVFQESLAVGSYPFLHVLYLWGLSVMEKHDRL